MPTTNRRYDPLDHGEVTVAGWAVTHTPAAATQATITTPAVAGQRNLCKTITACIAAGATPQTPINVKLIDGVSGGGTVLWSGALAAIANDCGNLAVNVDILGSVNTAMTLEFSGPGVAASLETVSMSGLVVDG